MHVYVWILIESKEKRVLSAVHLKNKILEQESDANINIDIKADIRCCSESDIRKNKPDKEKYCSFNLQNEWIFDKGSSEFYNMLNFFASNSYSLLDWENIEEEKELNEALKGGKEVDMYCNFADKEKQRTKVKIKKVISKTGHVCYAITKYFNTKNNEYEDINNCNTEEIYEEEFGTFKIEDGIMMFTEDNTKPRVHKFFPDSKKEITQKYSEDTCFSCITESNGERKLSFQTGKLSVSMSSDYNKKNITQEFFNKETKESLEIRYKIDEEEDEYKVSF